MMSRFIARLFFIIAFASATPNIDASNKNSWWPFDFLTTPSAQTEDHTEIPLPETKATLFTQCCEWTVPVIAISLSVAESIYSHYQRNKMRQEFNENMLETRSTIGEECTGLFHKQAKEIRELKAAMERLQLQNEWLTAALNDATSIEGDVKEEKEGN